MVKKVFTLIMGLVLGFGAMAQMGPGNPTVPQSDIQFWTGTGSNRAVIAVTWEDDNEDLIGIAWGVQWNGGSIMLKSLMDTIAAYDSRFTMTYTTWVSNLTFVDPNLGLNLVGIEGWWWYNWLNSADVSYPSSSVTADMVQNGDFVDWMQMGAADTMIMATDPNAPTVTEATIAASDILYWVGTGSNQAVMAVNWADTALAWGYRWNGTATVADMMADIAAADSRFSYSGTGFVNDIYFNDGNVSLAITPGNYWGSTNNGVMDAGMGQTLVNGDFEKWGDPAAGVVVDSFYDNTYNYWWYTYAYPMTIHPVSIPADAEPTDASIAASDILFWVGHGENQVVMAINWADSALAWGYRFSTDSVLVGDMVNDIATADPRFSYEGSPAYISDFFYADSTMSDTLRLTPHDPMDYSVYFNMSVNHIASMLGAGQHKVVNGDFVKFADTYVAVKVDSTWVPDWGGYWDYTYAWPMTIHPVTVPDTTGGTPGPQPEHGPFCGAVGTEGCTAIAADSSVIVAWATAIELTRGPQNITNPSGPLASFGSESNAIGMATLSNTMEAVSLGDGGSALVTFAHSIRNGEGPDFAVFENSFSDNSLELAFVEVSTDGERFVRFPATCLTQTETQLPNAGQTDPTNINNLAGKFRIGHGTPFDLDELRDSTGINIDSIVYVRIVDVVGSIDPQYGTYDAFGHIINDPWPTNFNSSGFDLTGVAVLYENTNVTGIADAEEVVTAVYPNPTTDYLYVNLVRPCKVMVNDIAGRCVAVYELQSGRNVLDFTTLPAGIYMLRCDGHVSKIVKK